MTSLPNGQGQAAGGRRPARAPPVCPDQGAARGPRGGGPAFHAGPCRHRLKMLHLLSLHLRFVSDAMSRDNEGPSGTLEASACGPPSPPNAPGPARPHPSCPLPGAAAALHPRRWAWQRLAPPSAGSAPASPSEPGHPLGPSPTWLGAGPERQGRLLAPGWSPADSAAANPVAGATEEPGPHTPLRAVPGTRGGLSRAPGLSSG